MKQKLTSLEQLLDRIDEAGNGEEAVSLDMLMGTIGKRSFGPVLLLIGLILVSPLSGIPTLPSTMGVAVFLIALQMLVRRKHIWLPGWILRRQIGQSKLAKASQWLRRPARFVDRLIKERLSVLVDGPASWPIACIFWLCTNCASSVFNSVTSLRTATIWLSSPSPPGLSATRMNRS